MIIDTHAHLYYDSILPFISEVLERAKDAGVERIIVPAVDLETSRQIISMSEKYDMIYAAVGIHPCDVQKVSGNDFDEIVKLSEHEKVVAIGESGLDYYWDLTHKQKQIDFFKLQIELAKSSDKPIVIHTRNAIDDAVKIMKENYSDKLKGHFHCLSGSLENLKEIFTMDNTFVSYCGNVTFKKFDEQELVKHSPIDRLLSETDSPFLTPVPFRGKTNEPAYVTRTIKKIAEIKEMDELELRKAMYENAMGFYFGNN